MSQRLSDKQRQDILLTRHEPEIAALPPWPIVPVLADRGLVNSCREGFVYGSERNIYRVLSAFGQPHRQERARLPQGPRAVMR